MNRGKEGVETEKTAMMMMMMMMMMMIMKMTKKEVSIQKIFLFVHQHPQSSLFSGEVFVKGGVWG